MASILIHSHDPEVLAELRALAAAAGVEAAEAPDPERALAGWLGPAMVVVGLDVLAELVALAPPRRQDVVVVAGGAVPDRSFRSVVALGAEHVVELPQARAWLVERFADVVDATGERAHTIGVLGGSGGAGATTFACALGQTAARTGRAVVVDCDPLGAGVDRVLGLDDAEGVRWDALERTTGRLSARAFRSALPCHGRLAALTWRAGPTGSLQAFAAREALSACQRGHDLVVLDLPRARDRLVDELLGRCDDVALVVLPTLAGVASAARLCRRLPDPARARLVVRGRGLPVMDIVRATGIAAGVVVGDQRRLDEAINLGLPPIRSWRSGLGRAAEGFLDRSVLERAA